MYIKCIKGVYKMLLNIHLEMFGLEEKSYVYFYSHLLTPDHIPTWIFPPIQLYRTKQKEICVQGIQYKTRARLPNENIFISN